MEIKNLLTVLLLTVTITAFGQKKETTIEDCTNFIKQKLEFNGGVLGNVMKVNVNGCILDIHEINGVDTANSVFIDLGEINLPVKIENTLGIRSLTITGQGVYQITDLGIKSRFNNEGSMTIRVKKKDIPEFKRRMNNAFTRANELCKSDF